MELAEIGHGAKARTDILDGDPGAHQAEDQRVLDRQRIVAIVVADRDHRINATRVHLRPEAKAKRGDAGQVDLIGVFPAGIIFTKACGRDHRIT